MKQSIYQYANTWSSSFSFFSVMSWNCCLRLSSRSSMVFNETTLRHDIGSDSPHYSTLCVRSSMVFSSVLFLLRCSSVFCSSASASCILSFFGATIFATRS